MAKSSKFDLKLPPASIRHEVIEHGGHRVIVNPIKWRNLGGQYKVTEAVAYCTTKDCGWDTPKLFSLSVTQNAARAHVGLPPLNETDASGKVDPHSA